jgi:hypothetical protein
MNLEAEKRAEMCELEDLHSILFEELSREEDTNRRCVILKKSLSIVNKQSELLRNYPAFFADFDEDDDDCGSDQVRDDERREDVSTVSFHCLVSEYLITPFIPTPEALISVCSYPLSSLFKSVLPCPGVAGYNRCVSVESVQREILITGSLEHEPTTHVTSGILTTGLRKRF